MTEWLAAGPAEAEDGEIREVGGMAVIRAAGGWYAVAGECTHADCPFRLDGEVDGSILICNCHGSEFDLATGAVLQGPADQSLRTAAVRVVDGRLEVARAT